jgi:hypothetical protein
MSEPFLVPYLPLDETVCPPIESRICTHRKEETIIVPIRQIERHQKHPAGFEGESEHSIKSIINYQERHIFTFKQL